MPNPSQSDPSDSQVHLTLLASAKRSLPWLRMFRGFRLAIDYQKLTVSLTAILVWMLGSHCVHWSFRTIWPGVQSTEAPISQQLLDVSHTLSTGWESYFGTAPALLSGGPEATTVYWPLVLVTRQLGLLFLATSSRAWWFAWLQLLWSLAVASLFGSIVSRMAARELTSQGRSLVRDARFAMRQFPTAFFAPVLALLAIAVIWSFSYLAGVVGRLPVVGEALLGLGWFAFLLVGLLMALLLVGVTFGWPLMSCSSAVERNDASDALSRTFSYLFNRTWYAVFLASISVGYGMLTLNFVELMTRLSVVLSATPVAAGLGLDAQAVNRHALWSLDLDGMQIFSNDVGVAMYSFWMGLATLIPAAYGFSYFWSSSTIIYLLLRKSEDGTPLDVLDFSDNPGETKPDIPLVGMPAAQKREQLRTQDSSSEEPKT